MLPIALTLAAILGGTLASYLYDDDTPLVPRLCWGAVTGMAALAFVAFLLANVAGIEAAVAVAAVVLVVGVALLLRRTMDRLTDDLTGVVAAVRAGVLSPSSATTGPLLYAIGAVVLVVLVFERVIIVENGVISTGYVNNLGDLPLHMQIAASFAYSGNFPPENPSYAGTSFAYPYMADFIVAMFLSLGATIRDGFFLGNVVLGLALIGTLYRFTHVLTGDRLAAAIAPLLVLFSGGLGWVVLFSDAAGSELGLFGYLQQLPRDYTLVGEGPFRWGNAITTLLVTQRSLLFGLPLALVSFTLLWRLIHQPPITLPPGSPLVSPTIRGLSLGIVGSVIRQRPGAVAAGIFTGLLPLVHAHSFVVVIATSFFLGLIFRQWREGRWLPWAVYVLAALAIALPEIWWSTHGSTADAGAFFGFEFGWDRGELNPLWFWFLNTGLFIPLIVVALGVRQIREGLPASLLLFSLPFLVWFAVPNVARLAPWIWDNIKVLFYWYVGFVPVVALVVAWMLRSRLDLRTLGALTLAALILAGSVDVWRVVSRQTIYQEFDADGVAIADAILRETPTRAMVLHAPTWNPAVYLTGRRSLLGYTGHIWAHGLEYGSREADIKEIYAGGPNAMALLAQHEIDYVLVSPIERFYMPVDDGFWEGFTEVTTAGEYRLYQVNTP